MKRTILCCLTLLALIPSYAEVEAQEGIVKGNVVDPNGASLSATIVIHLDELDPRSSRSKSVSRRPQDKTDDLTIKADHVGSFSAVLRPGFYDIAIFASGFTPVAHKVRIHAGKSVTEDFRLQLNAQWEAEHSDNFGESTSEIPIEPLRRPQQ